MNQAQPNFKHEHITVLLSEAVEHLVLKKDGIYVDCTFGRGGHSKLILEKLNREGRLIAIDRDKSAYEEGLKIKDMRFEIVRAHFSELDEVLEAKGISKVDGVLLDLGISSPQIDEGDRGFSFRFDAYLDMRMDQSKGVTAAELLKKIEQKELEKILKKYGEEKFARRISTAIIKERDEVGSIETTKQLAKIVADHMPKKEIGQDPSTRTFQALRIYINRELEELKEVLPKILKLLKTDGILVAISFHSLEDRIVKQFINDEKNRDTLPSNFPIRSDELPKPRLNNVTKPIRPSEAEVKRNPRARSGIMRVAERTAH
ncbi:COG0275 Predicted S-adenosylmethionine-dependent methyltransferase involved in cell envelope biogenesis [Candidatus Methylopumilus universalis]|uniref:16S rRNA (cytosine(1402)-N(4))-methyltransferase RsmH n=1 Tax=Candidatus Methylopumilus universalis TaxID=2588536 RepID=UPI003BEF1A65